MCGATVEAFAAKSDELVEGVVRAEQHVTTIVHDQGIWTLIAVIATAYAAGAGTDTGIEALSVNAHNTQPPPAHTGHQPHAPQPHSSGDPPGGRVRIGQAARSRGPRVPKARRGGRGGKAGNREGERRAPGAQRVGG